jgi:hypothetical protein
MSRDVILLRAAGTECAPRRLAARQEATMSNRFRKGELVRWHWSTGTATGMIAEAFERRVQRTLKGSKIIRNGTHDNPAYLIEQGDGDRVLKRGSELSKA